MSMNSSGRKIQVGVQQFHYTQRKVMLFDSRVGVLQQIIIFSQ
jgi:hypothetical protein